MNIEMPRCTILNCKSSTDVSSRKERDISFHRFPHDPKLKEKWIEATGRKGWFPTKYNTICSKHFHEASFVEGKKRRLLTTKACPTIDVMNTTTNEDLHPSYTSSLVEVCRLCLTTDDEVTLYSLQQGRLKLYMDTIYALNNDSREVKGLPQLVCYECAAQLRKCYNIVKKIETSQAILLDIFAENGEITKTLVKNSSNKDFELKSSLESHKITPTYFYDYQYNYEQNISCLTKIEFIYNLNDNKIELDTKSHLTTILVEQDAGNEASENFKRDHSNNNKIKLDTKSNTSSKQTVDDKRVSSSWACDHSIENKIEVDTNNGDNVENDVTEYLEHCRGARDNRYDISYINSVSDNILYEKDETELEKGKECNSTIHIIDENDNTGLTDVNTENVLRPVIRHFEKNDINNIIDSTQTGEQQDETKNNSEVSPIEEYFDIVKFKTLQEKIDEWRKSMENPAWIKNKAPSSKVYKCELCSKMFANLQTYNQHSNLHDPISGNAECPVCKIRQKSVKTVKKHMSYLHSTKYYCKLCPNNFSTRSAAAKHHSSHMGRAYKCGRCSFSSLHCSALNKHVAQIHSHDFACELCGRAYVNRKGLQQHRDKQHPGQMVPENGVKYPCEECNFSFTTEEALRVHLLTSVQHKKLKRNSSMRNTCRHCGRTFNSISDLKEHMSSDHIGGRTQDSLQYPTACEYCDVMLQSRHDHYWHMRREHPLKRYQRVVSVVCEVCGRGFQKLAQLKRHKLRHSSPKVPCPICQKLFYDKILVEQHVAEKHGAERPHECPTCGSTFKNKPNLLRHMKIHTDVTPYECSLCGKQLKHKANLRVHVQTIHHKILCPSRLNPRKRTRKRKRDKSVK